MTGHAIDLTKIAWCKPHGQITAYGTWLKTEDAWRPCLVLVRAGDEQSEHCSPCIVTGDKLWVWSEEVGDEEQCGLIVAGFLDPLRMGLNAHNCFKILSIVRDHIGDVLSIPPRPVERESLGIMKITNKETGEITEQELIGNA